MYPCPFFFALFFVCFFFFFDGSHIYCLPVPLSKVPTGKWFCDEHGGGGKSERKKRMRRTLGEYEYVWSRPNPEGVASDDEFSDEESSQSDDQEADSEAENEETADSSFVVCSSPPLSPTRKRN